MVINYLRKNDQTSRLVTGWRKDVINIDKVNDITESFLILVHNSTFVIIRNSNIYFLWFV